MFSTNPLESATDVGLRYVRGLGPGISRLRRGASFRYVGADGKPLRDPKHLERIRALVIPPAWTKVWICPFANGHLQAVGRDAKGRKQYRYHARYREVRDQSKFSRMIAFAAVLANIRNRVEQDLALRGLPKEKVLAAVVRLLETSYIRVGNDEYAKQNDSFGLTTMKNRHVSIAGSRLSFKFRGKSGQDHVRDLTDRRLARIVKQCQELPGYELFEYVDEGGRPCAVDSADVNHYIREITHQDFIAKDFRTWAGSVLSASELHAAGPASSATKAKATVAGAIKEVARHLGNRPATCRKYYVHPAILEAYEDGSLFISMEQGKQQAADYAGQGLRAEEYCIAVVIAAYQQRLVKEVRAHAA